MSGRVSVRTVIVLVSHLCFKLSEAERVKKSVINRNKTTFLPELVE